MNNRVREASASRSSTEDAIGSAAPLLDVRMKPGDASDQHSHPCYRLHAITGGRVKLTDASGESAEVEIQPGDTMWTEAEEHSALNVGSTELHALFVEQK